MFFLSFVPKQLEDWIDCFFLEVHFKALCLFRLLSFFVNFFRGRDFKQKKLYKALIILNSKCWQKEKKTRPFATCFNLTG